MPEPVGFALFFNKYVIGGLFAFLGLLIGLAVTGGYRRPRQVARRDDIPEWAKPVNPTQPTVLLIVALGGGVIVGAAITWLMGIIVGVGMGLMAAVLLPIWLNARGRQKWVKAIDDETLGMLQLLILKLQSGQSLIPSLEDISHNSLHGPLKREIQEFLVGAVAGGANTTQVLARLRDSERYKNTWRYQRVLRHLTTSARAQMAAHKIAGRMNVLQKSLVDTHSLQLELEAELAQAKYSRWIVSATLPLTTGAFFMFAPEIAINLFETVPGQITLVAVIIMVFLLNFIGGKVASLPPLEL